MNPRRSSSPLHVMQVVHSLKQGGSERLAFDLARSFDPSKVRSTLCAIDFGGPLEAPLRNDGIPFHIMGRRPGFDWRLIGRLYRLFRSQRVNLVQTHHLTQLIYGAVGARLAGASLVHVEHEYFSLMRPKEQRRLRRLAPLCHRVVAVGEETARFIVSQIGVPSSKVTVIPNGVDVQRYAPVARLQRQTLGLPADGRLIGHVGRLEPEKDQAALLHAFRAVMDAHRDTRLVIIGDGSLRHSLEDLLRSLGCGDRVTLLGARDDVSDLLPHFDLFILPSLSEGLPLAVIEAMACAIPVI
ncbi:MAG: hypothetical protein HW404_2149, partial [Anaerolineales bacterium]|nr:hypothetical protein [Anaerolineales bacterium]